MHSHVRTKRASGPLDAEAKARLCNNHNAHHSTASQWPAATCLSGLIHDFLAGTPTTATASNDLDLESSDTSGDDAGTADSDLDRDREAAELVAALTNDAADPYRRRLAGDVAASIEALSWLRPSAGPAGFRRAVMSRLRAVGHNAGICRTRWESAGGLAGGGHEFIDVVAASPSRVRYIVDLEFGAELDLARATEGYRMVVGAAARVLVARAEAVEEAVRAVAEAARRSLRARGLSVPPWRKRRYLVMKWMGRYTRTIGVVASPAIAGVGGGEVKCRAVGFEGGAEMVVGPAK